MKYPLYSTTGLARTNMGIEFLKAKYTQCNRTLERDRERAKGRRRAKSEERERNIEQKKNNSIGNIKAQARVVTVSSEQL